MTQQRKNFDKRYKLHLAVTFTPDKPEKNFIRFSNGYAYAGDGYIFVRARLHHIANFYPDELERLEGKSISALAFQRLLEFEQVSVSKIGFETSDIFGNRITFSFREQMEIAEKTTTIFETTTETKREDKSMIGISSSWLARASKIIGSNRLRVELYKDNLLLLTDPDIDDKADVRVFMVSPYVHERLHPARRK
jgi:hypothetical protein